MLQRTILALIPLTFQEKLKSETPYSLRNALFYRNSFLKITVGGSREGGYFLTTVSNNMQVIYIFSKKLKGRQVKRQRMDQLVSFHIINFENHGQIQISKHVRKLNARKIAIYAFSVKKEMDMILLQLGERNKNNSNIGAQFYPKTVPTSTKKGRPSKHPNSVLGSAYNE